MRYGRFIVTALVLVAAACVGFSCSRSLERADARVDSGSTVVKTPCGAIEYGSAGGGVPLLLIHGAGGGFDQGLSFGRGLPEAGVRVIAPSRFGYLRTPAPADTSAEAQADAHACLLDVLGIDRVAVLGGSAGAPSAMQFCIRHPQRCERLILLVPAAYAPGRARQMAPPPGVEFMFNHVLTSDPVFWSVAQVAPRLLIRTILATPQADFDAAPLAEQERAMAALDDILPVSRRREGLLIDARVTSALPEYPLARITAPTLLITTKDDLYGTYENARYAAAHIRGARFISYDTGGHLWLGHGAEVTREIAQFVKEQP